MTKKYGCIGEVLKHSFSREIHAALGEYEYRLIELKRDELGSFAEKGDFTGINVTIPYKELIIPYLYEIDAHAAAIGAVNTVVNREGRLYGYNTDFYGMSKLIEHAGVTVGGKKVAILGTGGTSKTALAVVSALGAREVVRVSRDGKEGAITYDELYSKHQDTEVIINTTPVGMYPNISSSPVSLDFFPALSGVIDAVYNPLRTELILSARERGIPSEGGLYMLVAQGVRASEIFLDTAYPEGTLEVIYRKMLSKKENIALIGMPASGKSTVGAIIADELGRDVLDSDTEIVKKCCKQIPDIFKESGEAHFRELESDVIASLSAMTSLIIATGGGAVLKKENIRNLKKNSRIYFIDRPLSALIPTEDRPLSSTREAIESRYRERYGIYLDSADVRIDADADAESVAEMIIGDFRK